jgi:hypothetical protein
MRSVLAALCLAATQSMALAAPAPAAARAEIDALLAKLSASSCQFNRNGSWYGPAEARKHLLRKLKYLEDRDAVKTTEQFIELAASGSSMSGNPYLVKCGAAAPVEAKVWLTNALNLIRAGAKPASGK